MAAAAAAPPSRSHGIRVAAAWDTVDYGRATGRSRNRMCEFVPQFGVRTWNSPGLFCRCTSTRRKGVRGRAGPVLALGGGLPTLLNTALTSYPLVTKASAAAFTYGFGDVLAQRKLSKPLDWSRVRNFMVTGAGGGVLWTFWYDYVDAELAAAGIPPGAIATAISMVTEQFLWCPVFYGIYLIPMCSVLKWGTAERVKEEVNADLVPTLWGNAKIWTFLNLVIYNVPVEVRALVSNLGDILWSTYLSFLVQDTKEVCEVDDEECYPVEAQDVYEYLQREPIKQEVPEGPVAVEANRN